MGGCHPGFKAVSGLCLRHFCSVARCVGSFLNTSSGAGGRSSFLQGRNLVMKRYKIWSSQGQPLNQLQAVAQEPLSSPHSGKGPFQVWSGRENLGLGVCVGYRWMDRQTEDLGFCSCSAINSGYVFRYKYAPTSFIDLSSTSSHLSISSLSIHLSLFI